MFVPLQTNRAPRTHQSCRASGAKITANEWIPNDRCKPDGPILQWRVICWPGDFGRHRRGDLGEQTAKVVSSLPFQQRNVTNLMERMYLIAECEEEMHAGASLASVTSLRIPGSATDSARPSCSSCSGSLRPRPDSRLKPIRTSGCGRRLPPPVLTMVNAGSSRRGTRWTGPGQTRRCRACIRTRSSPIARRGRCSACAGSCGSTKATISMPS